MKGNENWNKNVRVLCVASVSCCFGVSHSLAVAQRQGLIKGIEIFERIVSLPALILVVHEAAGLLALVAREAVVEVLRGGWLVPLGVGGLLTAAVSASAGRALGLVSHRLSAVASRRLRLGARVAGLLAGAAIRTCVCQHQH